MSLNSDYLMQIIARQKMQEAHREAAGQRLARIALDGRGPWWRRLFVLVRDASRARRTDGTRQTPGRHRAPQLGVSQVAR